MTQDQFVEMLGNWLRANKQTSENLQISADSELLGSGLLDSFDFLDLIVHIESQTGRKVDLSVADPIQFSTVRGLWKLAANGEASTADQSRTNGRNVLTAGAEL
jgi:acyl carrier protein